MDMLKKFAEHVEAHLNSAVHRRKRLSSLSWGRRLLTTPNMFATTVQCSLLRHMNLDRKSSCTTFWGKKFNVILPEVVSSEILRFGYLEEAVARAFVKFLSPGDTVIDVGGHIGFFSSLALDLVGPNGQVHTFEPVPTTFACLKRNCFEENAYLNNAAVWCENTELEINDYGTSFSAFNSVRDARLPRIKQPKSNSVKVKAITIDDYCNDKKIKPSFVKVDAESAEKEVLQGMTNTLKNHQPIICIEVGDLGVDHTARSKEIIEFIMNFSYDSYEWRENSFKKHKVRNDYKHSNILMLPKNKSYTL